MLSFTKLLLCCFYIYCRDFRERPLWICNNVVLGNHFHSANLPEGSNITSGITKKPIPFRLIDGNYISAEIATCLQTSAVQNFRPVPNEVRVTICMRTHGGHLGYF